MSSLAQTIHLATDHAGFAHKEAVSNWLREKGFVVIDHGAMSQEEEDDFPDYVSKAAKAVAEARGKAKAIIFGGSGNGEAMMANRYPGVRAAVYYGGAMDIVTLSREHNDANILSIGARFISLPDTKIAIEAWLDTEVLPEDKRVRRNQKIETYTKMIRNL